MPKLVSFIGGLYHFKQLIAFVKGLVFSFGGWNMEESFKIFFFFFAFLPIP